MSEWPSQHDRDAGLRAGSAAARNSRAQPARRDARPAADAPTGLLSALFYCALALIMIVAAGGTFLLVAAPTDILRSQIVSHVKARTGRDLVIAGGSSLTFYPSLGLSFSDVSLSAPPGMGGRPTVTMGTLDIAVSIWPLLSRQIEVEQVTLRQPTFDFRIDSRGQRSWDFAMAMPASPTRVAQAAPGPMPRELQDFASGSSPPSGIAAAKQQLARLGELKLGSVHVVNGGVTYSDERTGAQERIDAIDLRISLKGFDGPVSAVGSALFRGETVTLDAKLANLERAVDGSAVKLEVDVGGKPGTLRFDGLVGTKPALQADGNLQLESASLQSLGQLLGRQLPNMPAAGPLKISGLLKAADKTLLLNTANIAFGGATAEGTLAADLSGPRPSVKTNLRLSDLDFNRFAAVADAVQPSSPTSGAQRSGDRPAKSIEDLIDRSERPPGAQVRGFLKRNGWSEDPLDYRFLGAIDLDAKLAFGRLVFREVKIGQMQTTVALRNRVLRANFDDVALYEGRGRGLLTFDGTGDVGVFGANISVDGISAQPFLKDVADLDGLIGRGRLNLAIAGQGATERAIVETLNGRGDFAFMDGAVAGFNLAQMLRGLAQGQLGSVQKIATEKTDFSELTATYTIASGIARNDDLRLTSPLVRLAGSGTVDLPRRELNYTLRPKLVPTIAGQGGSQNIAGLEIPVRVTGSWDRPIYTPDLGGIDANQAVDAVRELGRQLKGQNAGEILRGLLGGRR